MTTKEVAGKFQLLAKMMELHGENAFRVRAYTNAYNALKRLDKTLDDYSPGELAEIKGIGKSTSQKIHEILATGKMDRLEQYAKKTPSGIQDLLKIRGLGAKKVLVIWKEMGIESPGELLYACNENRLVDYSGFGLKTQLDVKQKIEYYLESQQKYLYGRVEENVTDFISHLQTLIPGRKIEPVGEFARKMPVINHLEVLMEGPLESNALESDLLTVTQEEKGVFKCVFQEIYPFTLHLVSADTFAVKKFELIASPDFLDAWPVAKISGLTEKEIFDRAALKFIPAERRETASVISQANSSAADELITPEDIQGILHNHSTYSDGLHTLQAMAEYVRDSGYQYFGISDHSKSAVYASGLKIAEVLQQFEEIDALNESMAPFKTFKGIESDILSNGLLDYPSEILSQFDFIVASIHAQLKMDEDKATARLIKAIENPYTRILGHPTGRLLLAREGYPINHKKVIDACAQNNVAIELNANPQRLDMDYSWIPYCLEKGVLISINPDAHSMESIHNVRFGVYAARKGGLPRGGCLNVMGLAEFEAWLLEK